LIGWPEVVASKRTDGGDAGQMEKGEEGIAIPRPPFLRIGIKRLIILLLVVAAKLDSCVSIGVSSDYGTACCSVHIEGDSLCFVDLP
jgi:hypothetical protein